MYSKSQFMEFTHNDFFYFHTVLFREARGQVKWLETLSYGAEGCELDRRYTVKQIHRFYGKIPGNHLPVHFPLFLRASACRTFSEIKIW